MSFNNSILTCSWNIKGCKHPIKGNKILSYLKKEKVAIGLLQETHLTKAEHSKLKRNWVGQVFSASYNSKSRGVTILINKDLPLKFEHCESDPDGCFVFLYGFLYGEMISILNVYAAPNIHWNVFTKLTLLLVQYSAPNVIIGGDWNCVLDGKLDKHPSNLSTIPTRRQKAIRQMLDEVGLIDAWHLLNPDNKDYTFYSNPHKFYSRIYFFLVPQSSIEQIEKFNIGSIHISDHAPVFLGM